MKKFYLVKSEYYNNPNWCEGDDDCHWCSSTPEERIELTVSDELSAAAERERIIVRDIALQVKKLHGWAVDRCTVKNMYGFDTIITYVREGNKTLWKNVYNIEVEEAPE